MDEGLEYFWNNKRVIEYYLKQQKKIENSLLKILPLYSAIGLQLWNIYIIEAENLIKISTYN